jgi:hypothetical protein
MPVGNRLLDAIFLDMRMEYYHSGNLEYLDQRNIRYKNNLYYESKSTPGNVFLISLGMGIKL